MMTIYVIEQSWIDHISIPNKRFMTDYGYFTSKEEAEKKVSELSFEANKSHLLRKYKWKHSAYKKALTEYDRACELYSKGLEPVAPVKSQTLIDGEPVPPTNEEIENFDATLIPHLGQYKCVGIQPFREDS